MSNNSKKMSRTERARQRPGDISFEHVERVEPRKPVFRPVGKRVQVLRYEGYSRERKNSSLRMLGTIKDGEFFASSGMEHQVRESEMREIDTYIYVQAHESRVENAESAFENLPETLELVLEHIKRLDKLETKETVEKVFADNWADPVLKHIHEIQARLRKSGYQKKNTVFTAMDLNTGEKIGA